MQNLFTKIWDRIRVPPPPPPPEENKISPELMRRIRAVQVRANFLANDLMAGEYVSAFKGRGMEFSEVREYQPGDDVRLIDWNVTARMNAPFIKEFREERELTVMLMVDVSSSGEFGSVERMKNEVAAEAASVLAFLAVKNNDKIGLIVFSDKIEHYVPPKKGKAHVWNIIRTILNFNPEGRETNLSLPLEYLLKVQKRKCAAFFISDFQGRDYETSFKLAKQKHDVIAFFILDPREFELPQIGLINFQDAETGETIMVDALNTETVERFHEGRRAEHQAKTKFLKSIGMDTVEIYTHQPMINPILKYFKMREKRR